VRALLAALVLAGGLPLSGHAQQAVQTETLYESRLPVALCNATTAIRVVADSTPADLFLSDNFKRRSVDIERIALQAGGAIERRRASIFPGDIECLDDYIATYLDVPAGHVLSRFMRWPKDAAAPVSLEVAADLGMSGPGIVFSAYYPTETVQQSRARLPAGLFLLLPEGVWDMPTSSVRAGTSPTGAPLLLVVQKDGAPRNVTVSIVETGRDPVALHRAELRLEGVAEKPEVAVLSTWRSRPAMRFAYRAPDNDNFLVVGAAICNPPHALSDDEVECHPLVRARVPSDSRDSSQWAWGVDRTLIAIAEDGTRAFVATTDLKRSCLRVVPLGSSGVVDAPSACAFEVDGWVRGLGAVSDHEILLLVTQGDNEPTYRLLRVRDL
jgi:hypothetical protein